jgi:hypothetical protein
LSLLTKGNVLTSRVILAGILHVICVMTPLIVVAMRKRRAKASKSKDKGDA